MNLQPKPISTSVEYVTFVKQYIILLENQFKTWESWCPSQADLVNINSLTRQELHELIQAMPAIISLVNTLGYLRGQDGIFINFRPSTDSQKDFYQYEDYFEDRLNKLIQVIMNSSEKDFYKQRLENYLVKSRFPQSPTAD